MNETSAIPIRSDERLIIEGEANVESYKNDLKNARVRIMPMARGLCAAKRLYPATQNFGKWLETSPYREIEADDRAALIHIGEHDDFATKYMRTTKLVSPELIWDAIKDLLSIQFSQSSPTSDHPNSTSIPEKSFDPQPTAPNFPAKTETATSENAKFDSVELRPVSDFGRPSLIKGLPNDVLINTYVLNSATQGHLAKLYGPKNGQPKKTRPIWDLAVASIQGGYYGPPNDIESKTTSISLIMPWLGSRSSLGRKYDLTEESTRKLVSDVIFPLLSEKPELKKNIYDLEKEITSRRNALENQARRRLLLERHKERVETLPANEKPIIAYGTPLWPALGDISPRYTYDELCHACWFSMYFLDLQINRGWRPKDAAMSARHLTKYIEDLQPGFVQAVREIFNAYEDQPEGKTQFPSPPVNGHRK